VIFNDFQEGKLTFPPTYKFLDNMNYDPYFYQGKESQDGVIEFFIME